MKTTALCRMACLCLIVTSPASAIKRKHTPWLLHSRKTVAVPVSAAAASRQELAAPKKATLPQRSEEERTPIHEKEAGKRIVRQALRYQGTRYKRGGDGKRGMDCSGLVARVWSDLKLKKVPRVSSALYQSGQPVRFSELRPGDLVFFKNTYKRGISHVGVYTGNNKFVHAANRRKGVTITRLSDPYYQVHYAGARRLY